MAFGYELWIVAQSVEQLNGPHVNGGVASVRLEYQVPLLGFSASHGCHTLFVIIPAAGLEPLWYASTEPKPNRVLLFSVAPVVERTALPVFAADGEASERGVVFGPDGLEDVFAFSLHTAAAKRYFEAHSVRGPHDFVAR